MEPQLEEVIEEAKRVDEGEQGEGEEEEESLTDYEIQIRDLKEQLGKAKNK